MKSSRKPRTESELKDLIREIDEALAKSEKRAKEFSYDMQLIYLAEHSGRQSRSNVENKIAGQVELWS